MTTPTTYPETPFFVSEINRDEMERRMEAAMPHYPPQSASSEEPATAAPIIAADPQPTPEQGNLFDRAVLLNLVLRRMGNRRKVAKERIGARDSGATVEADCQNPALLAMSKQLVASSEYDAIASLFGEARAWIYTRCLPSPFRKGVYFLPLGLIPDVEARLTAYRMQLDELVERLARVYPALQTIASRELGAMYNAADYPTTAQLRESFGMEWSYQTVSTPKVLESIDRAIYAREAENARRRIEEATEDIKAGLRESMADLVSHMVDRLTPTDGKKKIFKNTMTAKFQDFLATFEVRNLANDGELAALAGRARQLLNGIDPETLRDSEDIRNTIREGLAEVKNELDTMITAAPRRRISFEESEG